MSRPLATAIFAAIFALPGGAVASSSGQWHSARPESGSCGLCHGVIGQGANPTVFLGVRGLPASYTPGNTYELTVTVVGPVVPLAGFNLEVTGGDLAQRNPVIPGGGTPQVGFIIDECEALEGDGKCCPDCGLGSCEVSRSSGCPMYGPEYPACACAIADKGNAAKCRPCSQATIVSVQATHTATALVPAWNLRWTAPGCGFGPVRFYLAGNSVNGDGSANEADLWGVLPAPITVPEGTCAGY